MISSTRSQRAALFAYSGLALVMSGFPMASIRRLYTLSPLPAGGTQSCEEGPRG